MGGFPSFSTFFQAVNGGTEPFPWQRRLAEQVVAEGWPTHIGVPTGLGKTACLDVAVWSLAAQAASGNRKLPTRIWYVVNRRLLVDVAWERSRRLAMLLANPSSLNDASEAATVGVVARSLRGIAAFGSEEVPLHIVRLRGGADLGVRAPDPSQPALLCATVPMFASRWLFRGYGSSSMIRPVDAALAGVDSLVLIDEAHLARPLIRLAEPLAQCDPGNPALVIGPERCRPHLVSLTATGEDAGGRFDLDDEDRSHPVEKQRLDAPKPIRLVISSDKSLPETLADQALSCLSGQQEPGSCVVFTNAPATARRVHSHVQELAAKPGRPLDTLLLTGRMRDREADSVRRVLLDPISGAPSTQRGVRSRDLIVVATQTLEVGADLDFEHLVTETAGVRALVQRLGRLNRLGRFPHATAAICHPSDRTDWPVYGVEPNGVWQRLSVMSETELALLTSAAVPSVLGEPGDQPARVGELLPAHLWEMAKTSLPPLGEAPVELFFEGFAAPGNVTVIWRAHLPEEGVKLYPPLSAYEAIELPLREVRDALIDRKKTAVGRLDVDRLGLENVDPEKIRSGDQLVLDAHDGLYDDFGWNPKSSEPVLDVSPLRFGTLLLTEGAIKNLTSNPPAEVIELLRSLDDRRIEPDDMDVPGEADPQEEQRLAAALIEALGGCTPHSWLSDQEFHGFLARLQPSVVHLLNDAPYLSGKPRGKTAEVSVRAEALDELSFAASSDALAEHLGSVAEIAERMARNIGCDKDLVAAIRAAAELHDIGKSDPRFQRWLDPTGAAPAPVAKSDTPLHLREGMRVAAGWPRGGRHELLSSRLADQLLRDHQHRELILHLIATHHGHGRPHVRVVKDPGPLRVIAHQAGWRTSASGDLGYPDWDQPGRFRRLCEHYGYWGLALLEAVIRQADHAASGAVRIA